MKISRRLKWIGAILAIVIACAATTACVWNPFSKPTLQQSAVILPGAPGVQPPAGLDDVFVVIYSGDGGWADLDRELGKAFAARGLPVVGINSFKYFWRERSPATGAAQLDALLTEYTDKWHKPRVWLVGFSFGADVLPTFIDKLGPANRARIAQLVLLSPSSNITFEIQFQSYMLAQGRIKAFVKTVLGKFNHVPEYDPLPPVVALANQFPVACYYGNDDAGDTLCTNPGLPRWITVHEKTGGHHLGESYEALAQEMLTRVPHARAQHAPASHPAVTKGTVE